MKIAIIGAGSWGTALSIILARNGNEVVLFGRNTEETGHLQTHRENLRYLPGFVLPELVQAVHLGDPSPFPVSELTTLILAVPSSAAHDALTAWTKAYGAPTQKVVIASKGLEAVTGRLMSEVVEEFAAPESIGVMSGPNLAVEIVRGIPTAAVVAFPKLETGDAIRAAFASSSFRIYLSTDVTGIELSGALKNVLAIAAGMSDGLGFGDNTKGALLARGMREMLLLGRALQASPETFLGIAGLGDLFATASSVLSRNYRVGYSLAKGSTLTESLEQIGQVAEGVPTARAVSLLARKHQVSLPIFEGIEQVLAGKLTAKTGVAQLMERNTPQEGIVIAWPN